MPRNERTSPPSLLLRKFQRRIVLVMIVASGLTLAFTAAAFELHWLNFARPTCSCENNIQTGSSSTVRFTVIMSTNGFNDSKIHGLPWPIMNVTIGQTVLIHLVNCDNTEPHGFSIGLGQVPTYVPAVTVTPGHCLDVSFTANTMGTFIVQCTIFCTPHSPWMIDGKLYVNS